jgi:hypothetical protein
VLLNYHIGRFLLGSLCVGDLVRLALSSVPVAGVSRFLEDHVYSNCRPNTTYMDGKLGACSHKNNRNDILGTTVQICVYSGVVLVQLAYVARFKTMLKTQVWVCQQLHHDTEPS